MLPLVIGSSFVSLGTVLAAFMGGMGLGSLLAPRLIGRRDPLRVYAALELGIGVCGLAILWGLPVLSTLYTGAGGGHLLVRAAISGICLVPPAICMGATLPVVARSDARPARLGAFYAANLAGAVTGCLVAGFYLLRVHDVGIATGVALALNLVVAAVAWRLGGARATTAAVPPPAVTPAPAGSRIVMAALAVSGFTALASEVIWTRQLGLVLGGTVYAFSLILAVFLAGLGIGSSLGTLVVRLAWRSRVALGWCQMLLAGAAIWAAHWLSRELPYWPVAEAGTGNALVAQLDIFRCALVVLPGAMLWGASFPLAVAAAAGPHDDGTALVGRLYAANTFGAVAGAIAANLMIAAVGSHVAERALVGLLVVSALALLVPPALSRAVPGPRRRRAHVVAASGAALAILSFVPAMSPVPGELIAYGRYSAEWMGVTRIVYSGEGTNASIAVSRASDGTVTYHSAGKVQASSLPEDMRLQRMLGHFSHLLPAEAKDVLVIGFGAGVTAGALAISPRVERMIVAEIEPLVPRFVAPFFADYNERVTEHPKTRLEFDDARHFLMTTDRTFDVITSDMVDPWVKGTAALFTREFFEAAKQRLEPGGVVTLFVQLYQSNVEAVKSELATFIDVFPHTAVWGNTNNGAGYDLVVTGQVDPIHIDIDVLQNRLASPAYAGVARSLAEVGMSSAVDLLSTYAGSAADLGPWLKDAAINRDRNLRLQYLAGLGMHERAAPAIYGEMLRYATFPAALFAGAPASVQAVRDGIDRVRRR
jgi:spermidine synthase